MILMALAAGPLLTSSPARIRINSKFESVGVNVIAQRFHAGWKSLRVNPNISVGVPADLPAIVDHHVLIAGVLHSAGHHAVGHGLQEILADVASEFVPTVPAHRRSQGHAVIPCSSFICGKQNRQKANRENDRTTKPSKRFHFYASQTQNSRSDTTRFPGGRDSAREIPRFARNDGRWGFDV